jgi:L-rhamnose mutarotase
MIDMLHAHGGKNYTIFLDPETNVLYGSIEIENEELWEKAVDTAINRKWWDYMADIMETNSDNSPVSHPLVTVFHMD